MVQDYHPTSKWQQGMITAMCGELTYQVYC